MNRPMKTILTILLAGFLSTATHGAVSNLLFPTGGAGLPGAPGNVIFNGQHFVSPTVLGNGAMQLLFLDTNGIVVSNLSLSITGRSPRVAKAGADYLLSWLETNSAPNLLSAARISQATAGPVSLLATNVVEEAVSFSVAAGEALIVWQSAGSNSVVFARLIDFSAASLGNTFAVSATAQPQRYPSVDNDGTNHLVAWMEQNIASNDWRVVAQRITGGALNGSPTQVSETNSMRPYATACSFGTNYLVAWSADEGPWIIDTNLCCYGGVSHLWQSAVHVRMLSESGAPLRHEISMLRGSHYNTNVVATFGARGYLVACYTWGLAVQFVQPLLGDGTLRDDAMTVRYYFSGGPPLRPRVAATGDRYCVLYQCALTNGSTGPSLSLVIAPQFLPELRLIDLHRTNNSFIVDSSFRVGGLQVSTNMIDWENVYPFNLPSMGGKPRLFVRQRYTTWSCLENLRHIDRLKKDWAFKNFPLPYLTPSVSDLFSSPSLMPQCPYGGVYGIEQVYSKPTCTVADHTL